MDTFFYWLAHFSLMRNPPKWGANIKCIVRTFFGDWFVGKLNPCGHTNRPSKN